MKRPNEYHLGTFVRAVMHGLNHRRKAGEIGHLLAELMRAAARRGKWPWFTTYHLNRLRNRSHRNTPRDIVKELVDLGLIWKKDFRPGMGQRFGMIWPAVMSYCREHGITVLSPAKDAPESGGKAAWDARRLERAQKMAAAAKARTAAATAVVPSYPVATRIQRQVMMLRDFLLGKTTIGAAHRMSLGIDGSTPEVVKAKAAALLESLLVS